MRDVRGGLCVMTLEGHTASVSALAVIEEMLIGGLYDMTLRMWRVDIDMAA